MRMHLQSGHCDPCGDSRQANEVQEDKEQLHPQAARRQGLGTALQEFSCAGAVMLLWSWVSGLRLKGCELCAGLQVGHVP